MRLVLILLAFGLSAAPVLAIEGRVVTSGDVAIEHARLSIAGTDRGAFTDRKGRFQVAGEAPLQLTVTHPRFVTRTVDVSSSPEGLLQIVLEPKQEIYERVAVSARRGAPGFSPSSVSTGEIEPSDVAAPPTTMTEMVTDLPAVSENGQGGIFQTYSIRGVSRQRVLTLVSGMRIASERRAGVSASFIDPTLMGAVDVQRGPSSTYYGSGGLGGVVQVAPVRHDDVVVAAGYLSQGNENYQMVGWGNDEWSLGVARRDAGQAETPEGETLNSGFTQVSTSIRHDGTVRGLDYEAELIASRGEDIGKANTDYPERSTNYPEERHLLARFSVGAQETWRVDGWIHPNDLQTLVDESTTTNQLDNNAFDFGANGRIDVPAGQAGTARVGLDYFARRNVDALEEERDLGTGVITRQATLTNGSEDELGLYGAFEWTRRRTVILAGGRFAWQRQSNAGATAVSDTAATAFVGILAPLGGGFEILANLGTGLRFPSLSERFFSGTTGRGEVTGNPDLDPERSLTVDAGLRWFGKRVYVAGFLFHNRIADYIEREFVGTDELTFVNLVSGTIRGVELDGRVRVDDRWRVNFGAHAMEGRSDEGFPLADVPADRVFVGARGQLGPRWSVRGRFEQRARKTDPGAGENSIPPASILSASVEYTFDHGIALSLSGRNLLDDSYYNSADDKAPLSPARAIGFGLRWTR